MLTKAQLKSYINKGLLLEVYTDCRRYGTIKHKHDYEYTWTVNFKTNETRTDLITSVYIVYKDLYWTFELCKGLVQRAGWSIEPF